MRDGLVEIRPEWAVAGLPVKKPRLGARRHTPEEAVVGEDVHIGRDRDELAGRRKSRRVRRVVDIHRYHPLVVRRVHELILLYTRGKEK